MHIESPTETSIPMPLPEAEAAHGESSGDHEGGLLLVGLFKLSKAIFFSAVGAGALHLVHRNVGDVLMKVIDTFRIDQEGRLASFLMDRADLLSGHTLRRASLFAFSYAVLCLIEGAGLVTRQVWAEYFTLLLTLAALPWEIYELVRKFEPYKVGLLLVNIAVLIYLLWFLKRKREKGMTRDPRIS